MNKYILVWIIVLNMSLPVVITAEQAEQIEQMQSELFDIDFESIEQLAQSEEQAEVAQIRQEAFSDDVDLIFENAHAPVVQAEFKEPSRLTVFIREHGISLINKYAFVRFLVGKYNFLQEWFINNYQVYFGD